MRRSVFSFALAFALLAAPFCFAQDAPAKRPMTFEDMMKMKRLGETAVSPDGKWLAYSVTTVDLGQNTKTSELWLQMLAGGQPIKLAVAQPGDNGLDFAPDGRRILFLSSREGGQQVWTRGLRPRHRRNVATQESSQRLPPRPTTQSGRPTASSVVFTSAVYPDCAAITEADFVAGNQCNADRDAAAAASKVKAQIFTHLLYRHWDHYTGDKRVASFPGFGRERARCAI